MKIAAILENDIASGGGFNQALNAILQMARLCKDRYEYIVLTNLQENVSYLNRLGIYAKHFRYGLIDIWLTYTAMNPLFRSLPLKFQQRGRLEKSLIKEGVDLTYFVTAGKSCLSLQEMNYITTVWDLCHRDHPEFPEMRENNQFLKREYSYRNTLSQALFILTDSTTLSKRLAYRYGIENERILAMPYSPSPFIEKYHSSSKKEVLKKYGLTDGYYFYPAQFWMHKNHVRILQALVLLKKRGINRQTVFSGGNHGNLCHIKAQIKNLELIDNVRILDFVPTEDMRGLYEGCSAVVMPTYFGPTNLPPLESWQLGKPLIYSSNLTEQAGNGALLVNPDSSAELAEAMTKVLEPSIADSLIRNGVIRLAKINKAREKAEHEILNRLYIFSKRLECWKA
jgi:glycosyltransferase involved in cell wall biosynthesis